MVILLISISSSCLAPVSTPQITKSAAEISPHKCAVNTRWVTFLDIKLGINISYPLGYFAGKTGVKIWTINYNQACANRCAYKHIQITDLNHILTLYSVDPNALPHINKCVRDPPGEKCFGALKGMCLLSLAAATVVCLGWTQQEKMRHLATIVTMTEQTEKDKERQKTKKKAKPLLWGAKQQQAFRTSGRARLQLVCWIKLPFHYQRTAFIYLFISHWWNLIA